MAGIATNGGVRPSSDGGNKRSGSRYVLGDLLGRGGMAEVFAGYAVGDHGFQKPVAIKRLLPELANDEVFVERLIEEAKLLVGMQHGHIVSVLDLAREGDDVFLVMEFVDGPSLRQLIKARGARGLSLGVATYIVQSAAAGLEFAHARPGGAIIHADISPSNLLLTTSGEVRVADFGIARREGLGHGVVEGKWAYMAPEQARGEPLTPRSDVFALGVVIYELLTGQHPFGRAVTPDERDQQIQIIPPRVVKPSIPTGLDAICMRALAHSPRDRYARMQQLIDALVEERFSTGLREGAADLAQAIREVAPKSDVGSPRTMHTDRPVTLMTRSLLRDVTPARRPSRSSPPARSSQPSHPPPAAASEIPSSDEFAVQPTMALVTSEPAGPSPDELAPVSGAQTMARMVDQVALARAAQAAQAMLAPPVPAMPPGMAMSPGLAMPPGMAMPPGLAMSPALVQAAQAAHAMLASPAMAAFNAAALRADGTPMPPFRAGHADVRGDELASVVGGHTVSHGAGIAVESRHRWTMVVLGMAALIGVVAAVVIQLTPSERVEAAPERSAATRPADDRGAPEAARPSPRDDRARPAPPTSQDPSPAAPGAEDPAAPAGDPTPAPRPVEPPAGAPATAGSKPDDGALADGRAAGDGKTADGSVPGGRQAEAKPVDGRPGDDRGGDGRAVDGKTPDGTLIDGKWPDGKPSDGKPVDGKPSDGKLGDGKLGDGKPGDGKPGDGKPVGRSSETRTGDVRSLGRRSSSARDGGRHKGILTVQSSPWSWVTVDVETKETPAKFYLEPGPHTVKFYSEDNGRTRYSRVTIEPDKVYRLDQKMD